jgi:hypothetical protein
MPEADQALRNAVTFLETAFASAQGSTRRIASSM